MARRSMPYHWRYHADALQGYRKLDLEHRGAYTTILDLIYDEFGPIEYDIEWLSGEFRCSKRKVKLLVEALIEKRKIYVTRDNKLSNRRADTEMEKTLKTRRKQRENGLRPKRKNNERSEKGNENNEPKKPPLSHGLGIPISNTNKKETITESEYVDRGAESADPLSDNHSRLVSALENRNPNGRTYAAAADRLRERRVVSR